jgi:hypothetical protein
MTVELTMKRSFASEKKEFTGTLITTSLVPVVLCFLSIALAVQSPAFAAAVSAMALE